MDILFAVNYAADFGVLFLVRQERFPRTPVRRIAVSALAGTAAYLLWFLFASGWWGAAALLFPPVSILVQILRTYRIRDIFTLAGALACAARHVLILGGASFLFGGVTGGSWMFVPLLAAVRIGIQYLCGKMRGSPRETTEKIYEVEIHRKGKKIRCDALYDSGNLLKSSVTGRGICVLTCAAASALLTGEEAERIRRGEYGRGIFPIRYFTVGESEKQMPGILADRILVRRGKNLLADTAGMLGVSGQERFSDGRFSVLLPEDLLR